MVFHGTPSRFARRSSSLVVLVVLLLLLLPLEAVDDITPRAVLMSQLTASASSFEHTVPQVGHVLLVFGI
jgi:hypothetical protein